MKTATRTFAAVRTAATAAVVVLAVSAVIPLFPGATTAQAQEKEKSGKKAPTEDEMTKAWMEAATPGQGHKVLADLVGEWTTKTKVYPAPGAPPMESDGTVSSRWILGNRFVESTHKGTLMGMPYEGRGTDGYDNFRKEYVSTWIDNMGTGITLLRGKLSADGKKLTYAGTMDEPSTGEKDKPFEFIFTILSKDERHFQIQDAKSGEKIMEMHYTRKK
jgi:hypothetical protein